MKTTQAGTRGGRAVAGRRAAGSARSAHRITTFGPIPPGMFVCHRCDTPLCINPAHLFLGSNRENLRDAASKGRNPMQRHPERSSFAGRKRTHCFRGHPFLPETTTYRSDGQRQCRTCYRATKAIYSRRRRLAKKALAKGTP